MFRSMLKMTKKLKKTKKSMKWTKVTNVKSKYVMYLWLIKFLGLFPNYVGFHTGYDNDQL